MPIEKRIIFIAIILSSIFVADNLLKYWTTPQGFYYAGYDSDEITFISAMKSYLWNFKSPWLASEDTVFHNLAEGSNFVIVPFGIFYFLFKTDLRIIFLIAKFLLGVAYFMVSYGIIRHFLPEKGESELAFLIFALAVGLGGLTYIAVTNLPFLSGIVSPENYIYVVGGGSVYTVTLGQLYLVISLVAGYASLLMYLKRRHKYGALFLALSIIAYPSFGNVFVALAFLYLFLNKKIDRFFFLSLLAYIPWTVAYIQKPVYFQEYSQSGLTYTNPLAFAVYGGFALLFSLYAYYNATKNYVKTKKIGRDNLFLLIFGAVTIAISIIPTPLTLVAPRFIHLTVLPLAIISVHGISEFSKKVRVSPKTITRAAVVLSLPTIIIFYFFVVQPAGVYIDKDHYDAMTFLKDQPYGNVISSRWPIGAIIPYYTEKRSMLGRMTGTLEQPLIEEAEEFYSGANVTRQKEILDRYKIVYVFYSPYEMNISRNFNPEQLGLVKIYDGNATKIYKAS